MQLKELMEYLETIAPLAFQEDYDNSGLLVGDPSKEITAAMICLDISDAVIDEALGKGCNLIISHHPFIFKGIKKIQAGNHASDLLIRIIRNDLAVYALHTNLDNSIGGLNSYLSAKLGLRDARILNEKDGMLSKLVTFCPLSYSEKVRQALFESGAGVIGKYDSCSFNLDGRGTFRATQGARPFVGDLDVLHTEEETRIELIFPTHRKNIVIGALFAAHPYEEVAYDIYSLSNTYPLCGSGIIASFEKSMKEQDFLHLVKKKLKIKMIRHTALRDKPVNKVALCSGSGGFLITDAIRAGADAFLTADLKYHDFFDFGQQILLGDIGHYESEQWIKDFLTEKLIENFPTFAVLSSGLNNNPVNYL